MIETRMVMMLEEAKEGMKDENANNRLLHYHDEEVSWQQFYQDLRQSPSIVPDNLSLLKPRAPPLLPECIYDDMEILNLQYESISEEDVRHFRSQRWLRFKNVLPPSILLEARNRIERLAARATGGVNISFPCDDIYTDGVFDGTPDEYWKKISEPSTKSWNIQMMWAVDPVVRALVCSPRIGWISIFCINVRLFLEQIVNNIVTVRKCFVHLCCHRV